jgi:hypothetical protein
MDVEAFAGLVVFASSGISIIFCHMSFVELKNEAAKLPVSRQRELMAYLVALQTSRDDKFRAKLAGKVDDEDSSHWMELNEVRKRYAE